MAAWVGDSRGSAARTFFAASVHPVGSLERMLDTPRRLLAAAAACATGFVVLLGVVYGTDRGVAADTRALRDFGELQRPRLAEHADGIAHLADPVPFAVISALLVVVALVR